MNRQTAFMVGLSAILFARSIPAQTSSADSLRRVALASYDEKNYPHSATAYAALARLPDVTAVDLYNAACSFALAGNIDQAFHYLERAITNGFDAYTPMRVDPDLTAVRADKRWRALASRIDEKEREKAKILASLPNATKPFSDIGKTGFLPALVSLEAMHRDSDAPLEWRNLVGEVLAWTRAMVGDVGGAIALYDSLGEAPGGSVPTDFYSYAPISAVDAILSAARKTRVVMINEAHHVPMHRVLTTELLSGLYAEGYRYLALEAVNTVGAATAAHPTLKTGTYTKDPVFADMLRAAAKLGFIVVAYDTFPAGCVATADNPGKCFTARDSMAAVNLYRQTFAKDHAAKVVVHAGYSHVVETQSFAGSAKALAYWLAWMTGIDPLTVDQTVMYGHSSSRYDSPEYRATLQRGWLKEPVVLRKPDGSYYRSPSGGFIGVDMQVFAPPTAELDGRPDWLFNRLRRARVRTDSIRDDKGRLLQSLIPDGPGPFLIQAFEEGEGADAIPYDQYVTAGGTVGALALTRGRYEVRISGPGGAITTTSINVP
jgi:hypothetical protein